MMFLGKRSHHTPTRYGSRGPMPLLNLAPPDDDLLLQVLEGLRRSRKRLPSKLFYDERGSRLFEEICRQPEYYITQTELAILQHHAAEIAEALGERCRIVEYGSGESLKTGTLLQAMHDPVSYLPLDISPTPLKHAAARIAAQFPELNVQPILADYTRPFTLPDRGGARRTIVYFPGSTIGNMEPHEARSFLRVTAERCGPDGGLLIGVDLKKEPGVLHRAYNDAAGVTAAFNLNMLRRLNESFGGTFDLRRFAHYAFYNPRRGRIEMHLASTLAQGACVAGERFRFDEGETIFTESSYKYTVDEFRTLADAGGWEAQRCWTDPQRLFAIHYLIVRPPGEATASLMGRG